jgi:hypothetical protein
MLRHKFVKRHFQDGSVVYYHYSSLLYVTVLTELPGVYIIFELSL